MKKTAKLLSLILCIALVLTTFAACSGAKEGKDTTTAGDTTVADKADETTAGDKDTELVTKKIEDGKVYNIGICQLVQHPALDAATEGFQKRLTELMGKDHVKFNLQNASGENNACATIVNQFVASKVDLIMANATAALQAAQSATGTIPIVGTSITDYASALDIKPEDWTGKTGTNIAGTSDLAPLQRQAEMFDEILPDAKTIGIFYCSSEANSKFQADNVQSYLEAAGKTVKTYTFADSNDIQSVVTKAVGECDALYVPTDNTAADNTELINNIAEPAGKPIIAGEEGICSGCGVATLSISYEALGEKTAELAYDILVNGKNPGDMDIAYSDGLTKKYDADRCKALNITVPKEYVAIEKAD